MNSARTHLRVAAIGDIHVSRHSQGAFQPLFTQITGSADVLLLCGAFTDYGLPDEAEALKLEAALARLRKVCQGTLLSRAQYFVDIDEWGYEDARMAPRGSMTEEPIADWTAAIDKSK